MQLEAIYKENNVSKRSEPDPKIIVSHQHSPEDNFLK